MLTAIITALLAVLVFVPNLATAVATYIRHPLGRSHPGTTGTIEAARNPTCGIVVGPRSGMQ